MMLGLYFSGTGNTKYCTERFVHRLDSAGTCLAMESIGTAAAILSHEDIVLAYPVYFSNLPKLVQDFLRENGPLFARKRVFILATMGLFSGDGAGCAARLLKQYGAVITGGLHVQMPDSIADEKALKRNLDQEMQLVRKAGEKLDAAARQFAAGKPPQDGLGAASHTAGLLGQRLWFSQKTRDYSSQLKIDRAKCVNCGLCTSLCPMSNLPATPEGPHPMGRCTMCYRCINSCPGQAITLLGKQVVRQYSLTDLLP